MQLLLDTHVLLWLRLGDRKLSKEQLREIHKAQSRSERLGVAGITLWEVAMLAAGGRIRLPGDVREFLAEVEANENLMVLPITSRVAVEAARLGPEFPGEPCDRLIAATARVHGLRLVTADERIRRSGAVEVI